jgi:formylglycine-generating enzyme required for sulfatase activity
MPVDTTPVDTIPVDTIPVDTASNDTVPTDTASDDSIYTVPSAGMVLIPGGTFQMGSNNYPDESPVHTVTLSSFWMDTTEVTQKSYVDVLKISKVGYVMPQWLSSDGIGDNYPAYNVCWYDAAKYCNARSRLAGLEPVYSDSKVAMPDSNGNLIGELSIDLSKNGFRLPTEAEWEYAYRGGTTTDFFWGDDPGMSDEYVCTKNNSGYDTYNCPVAQKSPNPYGLYDMFGNLKEWCMDWYGTYKSGPATDPEGPTSGADRVIRGQSNGEGAYGYSATSRSWSCATYYSPLAATNGFRVVRKAE